MKSMEARFAEAMDAVEKAGRRKQFDEKAKGCTTIESKLNAAEAVLKDAGIVPVKEATSTMGEVIKSLSHEQYQLFSKKRAAKRMSFEEQQKLAESILAGDITEEAPIRKHNGAGDTFVEGNPFGRTSEEFSPGYITETADNSKTTKRRKLMLESVADSLGSKKEAREFLGLPPKAPKGYKDLSEGQQKEFDFARMIGISEEDAFRLVKITGGYKQVSR